jgi:hypothetical protein
MGQVVAERSGHRFRTWRVVLAVAVVVVAASVGTTYGRYLFRSRPGPRSVSSALGTFRATTTTADIASPDRPAPAAGVYQLKGQGSEHISFPPNSQTDGSIMPATVSSLANGCWRWHVDYNVAHWEEYDFCTEGQEITLVADRNGQNWDFGMVKVKNSAQLSCQPPLVVLTATPTAGQAAQQRCTGTNTAVAGEMTASGPVQVVGTEALLIGGAAVSAVHEHEQTLMSGTQTGTVAEDWWYDARTGLPLRMERHIALATPSPLGNIHYTEDGSWEMTSLQPLA